MRLPIPLARSAQQTENKSLREQLLAQRLYSTEALRRAVRHLNLPIRVSEYSISGEEQKHFVVTGFILGCISIVASFFPVCGLPVAITGLFLGLYGRYLTPLRSMSTWAILLSLLGLLLACFSTAIMINIYFTMYVW